ncbi:MAG TPA: hypothetical protein VK507_17085 [Iamia sp.]|nr:hypothetical protein [Iamia sp.]
MATVVRRGSVVPGVSGRAVVVVFVVVAFVVAAKRGIDERVDVHRRVVVGRQWGAGPAGLRGEQRVEDVDATLDPLGAAGVVLVAEGVGERLDRTIATDQVAVAVEPCVYLHQRELAVAAEDLEARPAEGDALQGDSPADGGGKRRTLDRRRATPSLPGDGRPQGVAQLDQLFDDAEPLVGQSGEGAVDLAHAGEQVVPAHLGDATGHG